MLAFFIAAVLFPLEFLASLFSGFMIFKCFIFTCSGPPGGPWDKGPPLTYREKQLSCTPDSQHRDGSTRGL